LKTPFQGRNIALDESVKPTLHAYESQGEIAMKRFATRGLAAAVAAALLSSAPAHAITNIEANAGPQFNFVNPGARSLAMGGAFLGLADDSTAAYSNPAGLGQLSRKEWSVEARHSRIETHSARSGRLEGPPTGIGLDTVSGIKTQETTATIDNLSFLAFALPLEHGTIAAYRHELANFEAHFTSLGPFAQTLDDAPIPLTTRVSPAINDVDLRIVTYGLAGSWRVNSRWMLGASLNHYRLDFDTLTNRYSFDADGNGVVSPLERLTVLDLSDAALSIVATQRGDDSDVAMNLGVLWQPDDHWSVGAVYRQGPEFDYDFAVPVHPTEIFGGQSEFVVPDSWGVGVAYTPSDRWRVGLDLMRVEYSDHSRHVEGQGRDREIHYLGLDDLTEVRVGAEYTNGEARHPYSIRFGAWREPAHQMAFDGELVPLSGNPDGVELDNNSRKAVFIPGEDATHVTAGYGIVFDKFQLDAALDVSHRARIFSLSMVYYLQ
jgi:long-subunit fatty acid transport protein